MNLFQIVFSYEYFLIFLKRKISRQSEKLNNLSSFEDINIDFIFALKKKSSLTKKSNFTI